MWVAYTLTPTRMYLLPLIHPIKHLWVTLSPPPLCYPCNSLGLPHAPSRFIELLTPPPPGLRLNPPPQLLTKPFENFSWLAFPGHSLRKDSRTTPCSPSCQCFKVATFLVSHEYFLPPRAPPPTCCSPSDDPSPLSLFFPCRNFSKLTQPNKRGKIYPLRWSSSPR